LSHFADVRKSYTAIVPVTHVVRFLALVAGGFQCTFLQILLKFPRHLRVIVYSSPFHVHILCIPYGTVLASTAVLAMCVRIICLSVHGAPW